MKILCLVSANPGHLDFGGDGYLKLAKQLTDNGHTVHWLAPKDNVKRLRNKGFKAAVSEEVGNLYLIPMLSKERIKTQKNKFDEKIQAIRSLLKLADKYDLIICDRLLALGPILASKVSKPIVVIGSPSTHFELTSKWPIEIETANTHYMEVGEAFGKALKCNGGALNSFWANSPLLNICFVNRQFYSFADPSKSAYVNHFSSKVEPSKTKSIAFSFGNTGNSSKLISVINQFAQKAPSDIKIHAYAGRDEKLKASAQKHLPKNVCVHGWVNFHKEFSSLNTLVCFGGIGTLWQAIDCHTPVIALPDIGDQYINAVTIQRLGLGRMLNLDEENIENSYEFISPLLSNKSYTDALTAFKKPANFTDTIETIAIKIANI